MMIKFHKASRSGGVAADYLEDDKDHQGRTRENVEVLRGDPFRVGQIADSLDFKHRLTAGVIAWAPEDNPTPEQIAEVLDNFERLAWAGLELDRYAWSAVRHDEENGGIHVHIMAARVDLQTGKSLNIAPPGWQRDFDPLRDALNIKHGWARPDDPARTSDVHIESYEKKIKADVVKSGELPETLDIESLTDYLIDHINLGHINNRAEIKAALENLDGVTVTRAGKNYISVKLPGAEKATRLRGAIYDEQFNGDVYRETKKAAGRTGTRTPESRQTDFNAAKDRHHGAVRRRTKFNQKRYGEHQALTETESEIPVVVLPADSHDLPGSTHIAGGVDGGEIDHWTPAGRNQRAINRNTQKRRAPGDDETLEDNTESRQRHGTALPVTAQRITKTRTQRKRRRLSVRDAGRRRRDKGGMTHDRTRRTAPGRSVQTGGWYEFLVSAIAGNQQAIERYNNTYASSAKRFIDFFRGTEKILRGSAKIIVAAAQVASALYGVVKKAVAPTYSGPEIESG